MSAKRSFGKAVATDPSSKKFDPVEIFQKRAQVIFKISANSLFIFLWACLSYLSSYLLSKVPISSQHDTIVLEILRIGFSISMLTPIAGIVAIDIANVISSTRKEVRKTLDEK